MAGSKQKMRSGEYPETSARLHLPDGPRLRARAIDTSDAVELQECFDGADDYFIRTEGCPAAFDAAEQLLADAEADDSRILFLLEPLGGGSPTGMMDLHLHYPVPGTVHIGLLLFREACQGIGYGRETATLLEHSLATAGFDTIRISVGDENGEGRAFWERIGFSDAGRLDRGISVMEKQIHPTYMSHPMEGGDSPA